MSPSPTVLIHGRKQKGAEVQNSFFRKTSLPLLPLEEIASYLDFSSLVRLAASNSSTEQIVKGENFSVPGRSYRDIALGKEPIPLSLTWMLRSSGYQNGLGMEGQGKPEKLKQVKVTLDTL